MYIERDMGPVMSRAAKRFPSITLTGPRKSGKTTLCKMLFPHYPYVNLEILGVRKRAQEDPAHFLSLYPNGAVIDEIQRVPDLLSYLMVLIDEDRTSGKWILTGSQNFELSNSISQSLVGRTVVLELLPLHRREALRFCVSPNSLWDILHRGSYPSVFQKEYRDSEGWHQWYGSYLRNYIERDVRQLLFVKDLPKFQDFIKIIASYTSQNIKYRSLASDCEISEKTVKSWLGLLQTSYLVFSLPVMHSRIRKSLIKTPKFHFYDSGLVCYLLGINTPQELVSHQYFSYIFESWVASEIMKAKTSQTMFPSVSYYRDRHQNEVDLVLDFSNKNYGFVEIKSSTKVPKKAFLALNNIQEKYKDDLNISTAVIYAGNRSDYERRSQLISWNDIHHDQWWHRMKTK